MMFLCKISLIIFSTTVIQLSKSEEILLKEHSRIDRASEQCMCFSGGESLHPELLNSRENGLQRLVVYIYRDINTNQITIFTPNSGKQAIIPDIPISDPEEVKLVLDQNITTLMNNAFNNILPKDTNIDNIALKDIAFLPGLIQTKSTNIFPHLNGVQKIYQETDSFQQHNPFTNIPQKHQSYNFSSVYQPNNILNLDELNQLIKIWKELQDQPNYDQPMDFLSTQSHILSPHITIAEQTGNNKGKLSFDEWFNQQMAICHHENAPQGLQTINNDILKPLVQNILFENQMNIDSTGLITDANGASININTLELRPAVIGSPVTYEQFLQDDLTVADHLPYTEGILITLLYPPRILGFIPLSDSYNAVRSKPEIDQPLSSSPDDVYIDHYILVPSYTPNELEYGTSASSSAQKSNVNVTSVIPHLVASDDFEKIRNKEPLLREFQPAAVSIVAQFYKWLWTILTAVLESNHEARLNNGSSTKKESKTDSQFNTTQNVQVVQDNDDWKNVYPWNQKRSGYELNSYSNSNNSPSNKPKNNRQSSDTKWNWPARLQWENYPSNAQSHNLKPYHMIPNCQSNSLTTSEFGHYPTQEYHFYIGPHSIFFHLSAIPFLKEKSTSNLMTPFDDGLNSDVDNIGTLITSMHSNTISDTSSNDNMDSIPQSDIINPAFSVPTVSHQRFFSDGNTKSNFQTDPKLGIVSTYMKSHPVETSSFDYSDNNSNNTGDNYLIRHDNGDSSNTAINIIYNESSPITEKPTPSGPDTKSVYNVWNSLSHGSTKTRWRSKNSDNNEIISEYNVNVKNENSSRSSMSALMTAIKSLFRIFLESSLQGNNSDAQEIVDNIVNDSIERYGNDYNRDRPDYRIIGGSAATGSGSPVSIKGRSGIIQSNNDFIKKPGNEQNRDRPDYRIIGGSAATGSGSPVSNKGRSGLINTVDDSITKSENVYDKDHPDFRIIGGSAAMGSGSTVSNKGRSGFINIFDDSIKKSENVKYHPEFGIIGGSAAMGTGSPYSNKGRSSYINTVDDYIKNNLDGFRIIGGSAATGRNSPASNKDRSVSIDTVVGSAINPVDDQFGQQPDGKIMEGSDGKGSNSVISNKGRSGVVNNVNNFITKFGNFLRRRSIKDNRRYSGIG